jgi:hypothetical protein
MKKEKKDQIIRRISEQSMLKLTPMARGTLKYTCWGFIPRIIFWAFTGLALGKGLNKTGLRLSVPLRHREKKHSII